ncbi:MAG: peroxiredoxin [Afipia sp.]|jgi:peroxiredoxin Q/BCP|nr:peroxiredoxin [Afipia sp.]MCR6734525.1 peroxiredoxin [Afipia sp.]
MSKKTRKKSSKSASGRSASKTGGAKAKPTKRATAKKPRASAARKASSKRGATPKKTPAKTAKRSASKAASAKKSAAAKSKKKPAVAPARTIAALNEGDTAPAFSLPRDGGQLVSLADYAGRKLVIFFYPRANTPGCTLEAIAFSRLADAFASARTAVLGVSADPVTAQESFRDKHDLTVPLISDETLGMLKAYGVWGEKSMYGKTFMGISRTTVLIDGDGRIVRIWRNVKVDGHADQVLAAAMAA